MKVSKEQFRNRPRIFPRFAEQTGRSISITEASTGRKLSDTGVENTNSHLCSGIRRRFPTSVYSGHDCRHDEMVNGDASGGEDYVGFSV